MICVLAGGASPVLGVGAGGVAPSRHGSPGYYLLKNGYLHNYPVHKKIEITRFRAYLHAITVYYYAAARGH